MYEMNKLQVFQKKFRKNKRIGETNKECFGHSSVISALKGLEQLLYTLYFIGYFEYKDTNKIGESQTFRKEKLKNTYHRDNLF